MGCCQSTPQDESKRFSNIKNEDDDKNRSKNKYEKDPTNLPVPGTQTEEGKGIYKSKSWLFRVKQNGTTTKYLKHFVKHYQEVYTICAKNTVDSNSLFVNKSAVTLQRMTSAYASV